MADTGGAGPMSLTCLDENLPRFILTSLCTGYARVGTVLPDCLMLTSTTLWFNKVIVIESLSDGELKTGRRLYEDVLLPARQNGVHTDLEIDFMQPQSASELVSLLQSAASDAENGIKPIIHIEAHGNQEGLCLADRTRLSWEDLSQDICEINQRTGLNTLVTIGACSGAWFSKVATPPGRAPFLCLFAPLTTLTAGEVEKCFSMFYKDLFEYHSISRAVDAVVEAYPSVMMNNGAYTVRSIFQLGHAQFENDHLKTEQVEAYEFDLIRKIRADGKPEYKNMPDDQLRELFRQQAVERFNEFRDHFFMVDLYPENFERFDLSRVTGTA